MKKANHWGEYEEFEVQIRSQYNHTVERFPEEMDHLLKVLDRLKYLSFHTIILNLDSSKSTTTTSTSHLSRGVMSNTKKHGV